MLGRERRDHGTQRSIGRTGAQVTALQADARRRADPVVRADVAGSAVELASRGGTTKAAATFVGDVVAAFAAGAVGRCHARVADVVAVTQDVERVTRLSHRTGTGVAARLTDRGIATCHAGLARTALPAVAKSGAGETAAERNAGLLGGTVARTETPEAPFHARRRAADRLAVEAATVGRVAGQLGPLAAVALVAAWPASPRAGRRRSRMGNRCWPGSRDRRPTIRCRAGRLTRRCNPRGKRRNTAPGGCRPRRSRSDTHPRWRRSPGRCHSRSG